MSDEKEKDYFTIWKLQLTDLIACAWGERKISEQTVNQLNSALAKAADLQALNIITNSVVSALPPAEKKPETNENRDIQTRKPGTF